MGMSAISLFMWQQHLMLLVCMSLHGWRWIAELVRIGQVKLEP